MLNKDIDETIILSANISLRALSDDFNVYTFERMYDDTRMCSRDKCLSSVGLRKHIVRSSDVGAANIHHVMRPPAKWRAESRSSGSFRRMRRRPGAHATLEPAGGLVSVVFLWRCVRFGVTRCVGGRASTVPCCV